MNAARRYEPRIPTGAASEETRWALYRSRVRWPLGRTKYREFQVPERAGATLIVTPQFIAHAHRAGLPVRIWTVDEREDMVRLLELGRRQRHQRPAGHRGARRAGRGLWRRQTGVRPASDPVDPV